MAPAEYQMFNFSMSPTTNDIPAAPAGVKLTTLDNGLTIIVRRSRFMEQLLPESVVLKLLYDN